MFNTNKEKNQEIQQQQSDKDQNDEKEQDPFIVDENSGQQGDLIINTEDSIQQYNQATLSYNMGIFWCVLQGLTRGAMYSAQKIAQKETKVDLVYILLIRSLFVILGGYLYGKKDGIDFSPSGFKNFSPKIQSSLFWRSFYGYGSIVSAMVAINFAPESIVVSIMTTVVFVSVIVGYAFGGETITRWEILSISGGFIGVIMMSNENFLFKDPPYFRHQLESKKRDNSHYPYLRFGILMSIAYTLFSAFNYLKMREMGNEIHSSIKTYFFGIICSGFSLIYVAIMSPSFFMIQNIGTDKYPINQVQLLSCLLVGFFSWANQECLSLCLTVIKQGTSSAFNIIALLVSLATDALVFKRFMCLHDIVGSCLIVISVVVQASLSVEVKKQEDYELSLQQEISRRSRDDESQQLDSYRILFRENSRKSGPAQNQSVNLTNDKTPLLPGLVALDKTKHQINSGR